MKRAERGLIWSAFVFGAIAFLMVVVPYLSTYLYARGSDNPELGGAAFGMTFGIMMIAFGIFSWMASIIMVVINFIFNRPELKSRIGIATLGMNCLVIAYVCFIGWVIGKDIIGN